MYALNADLAAAAQAEPFSLFIAEKQFKSFFASTKDMSSASSINDSPNHFMVMDAIGKGLKTIGKIAKTTNISSNEVEAIANDLVTQRLAVRSEKKGFLGGKKVELAITDTGVKLLNAKKAQLKEEAEKMQQWYNNGNKDQLQSYMDSNRAWMPMMIFSGVMNAMFFMSMMSVMEMAMLPSESAFTGADMSPGGDGTTDVSGGDWGGSDIGGADVSF